MLTSTADVLLVIRGCGPGLGRKLYATLASLVRNGSQRFALMLDGVEFESCLDELREAVQSFVSASFIVVERGYEVRARETLVVEG